MKAIAILIDPHGEEWFEAYGPMTKDRSKATLFISPEIAAKAADNRFGRGGNAFWECERKHEKLAQEEYRVWKHRVEEVLVTNN